MLTKYDTKLKINCRPIKSGHCFFYCRLFIAGSFTSRRIFNEGPYAAGKRVKSANKGEILRRKLFEMCK